MLQTYIPISRFWCLHSPLSQKIWKKNVFWKTSVTGKKTFSSTQTYAYNIFPQLRERQHRVPNMHFSCPSESLQKGNCDNFSLIYKQKGMEFCRALSRIKILQTTLTVVLLPPVYFYYMQGQVTYLCVLYCSGTAVFACTMLFCISYCLQRIIGMIYLNDTGTIVKISHLTFWGKRKDIFIPVTDIKSLSETGDNKQEVLLQFKRYSSPEILYYTTRFGRILDKKKFSMLFEDFK